MKRVLIIAHGHPELRAGGAERAAYSLFQVLKRAPGVTPIFLATTQPQAIGHDGEFGAFRGRPDELLWAPPPIDHVRYASANYDLLRQHCESLIDTLAPDIIHAHHYVHTSVDFFSILKEISPARQVVTLHEYLLICHHFGQMVRTGSQALCYQSSPSECASCFPELSSGKFFLRERYIKRALEAVDDFIAPSAFLKDRYAAWGLSPERIAVIENPVPENLIQPPGPPPEPLDNRRLRLGYFGQLNPFKGAPVLLKALTHLKKADQKRVELVIFGANFEEQPETFRGTVTSLIEESPAKVSFFGRYRNDDVVELMRGVDWVVLPSTWWENSPLIIQEAKAAGVPVLASNIGGMREKVVEGVNGRHFLAGSDLDLARKIETILQDPPRVWPQTDMAAQNEAVLQAHLRIYGAQAVRSVAAV